MPSGKMLPVRLQVGLRPIELVVVVEVNELRLGVDTDIRARDSAWEFATGVIEVLSYLTGRSDELIAVDLDRRLDPRVVVERSWVGRVVCPAGANLGAAKRSTAAHISP
jgi:hypothetical protein